MTMLLPARRKAPTTVPYASTLAVLILDTDLIVYSFLQLAPKVSRSIEKISSRWGQIVLARVLTVKQVAWGADSTLRLAL